MFDAIPPEPYWLDNGDARSDDRTGIHHALAMTAAVAVVTLATIIGVDVTFPPHPDTPALWSAQTMPLL